MQWKIFKRRYFRTQNQSMWSWALNLPHKPVHSQWMTALSLLGLSVQKLWLLPLFYPRLIHQQMLKYTLNNNTPGLPRWLSGLKSPPANAGNMGLIPGPGRSLMPWSNKACGPQLLSLCSMAREAHTPQQGVTPQLTAARGSLSSSEDPAQPKINNNRENWK